MTEKSPAPQARALRPDKALTREERLKAALKANMAKRKAQARARAAQEAGEDD
ncbi:hypothetical protein SAMN05428995_102217 [Loktanella sp. DSM 29012]|uniref:hypothetical protein n=1 Tax=Loktanella sp. DSM 29012 TaxID=1881056 RepID=UPI0008CE4241|nr:hypothetical protein [Loktanella sp. DSM 29012]SEP98280.1 hypothetical protein SAMN05428995_102217 [Loktanella sp. DSM 29012]